MLITNQKSGFKILNALNTHKNRGQYTRKEKIQILCPDNNFIFEITLDNFIEILNVSGCTNGVLDGMFVFSFPNNNLTEVYLLSCSDNKFQNKDKKTLDLIIGGIYTDIKDNKYIYLGNLPLIKGTLFSRYDKSGFFNKTTEKKGIFFNISDKSDIFIKTPDTSSVDFNKYNSIKKLKKENIEFTGETFNYIEQLIEKYKNINYYFKDLDWFINTICKNDIHNLKYNNNSYKLINLTNKYLTYEML